jgi:hypothetical protein
VAVAGCLLGGSSGCAESMAARYETSIPNPIAGSFDPTASRISTRIDSERTERDLELPAGALEREATIVRADGEQVCFGVLLRQRAVDEQFASLRGWKVRASSSTNEDGLDPKDVQEAPQERVDHRGSEEVTSGGVAERRPAVHTIVTGGGEACFENRSLLSEQTEWLGLLLLDPKASDASVMLLSPGDAKQGYRFRWTFTPSSSQAR